MYSNKVQFNQDLYLNTTLWYFIIPLHHILEANIVFIDNSYFLESDY